jgi:hypothetical protein
MGKNQGVIEHDIEIGDEVIQECKVLLTDDELLDRGKKLAQAVAETNQAERDKAAYNSQIKSRLDIANGLTQKFRGIVAEGAEYRPVVCHRVYDYTARTVSVVRDDTGETVEYRPMEAHELQRHLDLNNERPVTQEAEDALFGDDDQTDEDGEE